MDWNQPMETLKTKTKKSRQEWKTMFSALIQSYGNFFKFIGNLIVLFSVTKKAKIAA